MHRCRALTLALAKLSCYIYFQQIVMSGEGSAASEPVRGFITDQNRHIMQAKMWLQDIIYFIVLNVL